MENQESETTRLAQTDTAIEIMAAKIGICMTRMLEEENKPENQQDQKLIDRLDKELDILYAERERLYAGDKVVQDKIYQTYAPQVSEYFLKDAGNVR